MSLFHKKKVQPELENKLEEEYSSENANMSSMKGELEKLHANVVALKDSRQVSNERFSRISEEIGELRSMLIDREKQIQDLEIKATKASELVSEVQPDQLMLQVKKEDAKLEALKNRVESNENVVNEAITNLKDVKSQMGVFRGVEQILELNDDVKRQLQTTQKISLDIAKHADKVEEIFITIKKKFPEIDDMKAINQDIKIEHEKMIEDFTDMKTKILNFSEKKEIDHIRSLVNDNARLWNKKLGEIETYRQQLDSIVDTNQKMMEEVNRNLKLIDQKIFNTITRDELITRMQELEERVLDKMREEKMNQKIDAHVALKKDEFNQLDTAKKLIGSANIKINNAQKELAKKDYLKANAIYENLPKENQIEIYDLLTDLYNRLTK